MKKILALLAMVLLLSSSVMAKEDKYLDVLPLLSSKSEQQNRVWVGTFQLAWNDLMNEIVKASIKFTGGTPDVVKQLNRQLFKAEHLNENSYYKAFGKATPELKNTIETAIKEKFEETSDVLDGIDWNSKDYLVYAILKKNFKFLTDFDKLKPAKFAHSKGKVEYFGIDKKSDKILDNMVSVLFYNSSKDFAIAIHTQGDDVLYLYRTNDDKTFDKLYSDMFMKKIQYNGTSEFRADDELKIPNINLYSKKSFEELCNQEIKGTDIVIGQAMETVDFKMNNEGVQLKSEAIIATKMSLDVSEKIKPKKFYFDDTFVLFLQEVDKNKPYFALRVYDASLVNKGK